MRPQPQNKRCSDVEPRYPWLGTDEHITVLNNTSSSVRSPEVSVGLSIQNFGDSEGLVFPLTYRNCELGHSSRFSLFVAARKLRAKCVPTLRDTKHFVAHHKCGSLIPNLAFCLYCFFLLLCFAFASPFCGYCFTYMRIYKPSLSHLEVFFLGRE